MPLRTIVLLNIGPGFGGFRLALRTKGDRPDQAETYTALEQVLEHCFSRIAQFPWDEWTRAKQELHAVIAPLAEASLARVDMDAGEHSDGSRFVVGRVFRAFPFWPLGGHASYDGYHYTRDAVPTPYTHDELMQIW